MNRAGHAATGCLAGLLLATAREVPGVDVVAVAALSAGAALGPDIDHPRATASTSLGVVTRAVSALVRTSGDHRETWPHWGVTAAAVGVAAWAAARFGGTLGLGAVLAVAVLLAATAVTAPKRRRRAPRWVRWLAPRSLPAVALAVLALATAQLWQLDPVTVGLAVGLGWAVHLLGDDIGAGRRIRWAAPLRPVTAGGPTERWVIVPLSLAVSALLVAEALTEGAIL